MRTIATQERVFATCAEIVRGGKVPTDSEIMRRIGGGSKSTINHWKRKWLEENSEELDKLDPNKAVVPSGRTMEALLRLYMELSSVLVEDGKDESIKVVEQQRDEAQEKVAQLESQVKEMEETMNKYAVLEVKFDGLQKRIEDMERNDKDKEKIIEFLTNQIKELKGNQKVKS